jgi:haloacetate dehalogenase
MSRLPIASLFEGFSVLDCTTPRVRFAGVRGGEGPPVLLLHGYPETHATWHAVAPALAVRYTVIIPDLPGYGRSQTLDAGPTSNPSRKIRPHSHSQGVAGCPVARQSG